jgi:hypothetical protein
MGIFRTNSYFVRSRVDCCTSDSTSLPGDCSCNIQELVVHEAEMLNLTLTDVNVGKVFINVVGAGAAINFPDITTVVNRSIEVYIICTFTGTITLTPFVFNSLGSSGIGVSMVGNVSPGDGGMFWVGSNAYWGILGSGGGGGGGGSTISFAFTSTAAQTTYTLIQIQVALIGGFASSLIGRMYIVHVGGVSYVSGEGDITTNGSGGFDMTFDPQGKIIVVELI